MQYKKVIELFFSNDIEFFLRKSKKIVKRTRKIKK